MIKTFVSHCLALLFFISISTTIDAQVTKVEHPLEKGTIENGYKVGVWQYFDSEKDTLPSLMVDYTKNKVLYVAPDTSSYVVKVNNEWQNIVPQRQPRYIGSLAKYYALIAQQLVYPQAALDQWERGTVYLYFEVDSVGKAGNFQTIGNSCNSCSEELKRVFNLIPNYWLSAKVDGQYVHASFIQPVVFKLSGQEDTSDPVELQVELPKARMLSEVHVVAINFPDKKKADRKKKKHKQ